MILEVEHLSFAYRPERPLFYDVSFAFEQGQVLSILGANGAGKSTLLNCIANLLLPQQGEIRLHGTPLSRLELREISRIIGYVPQSHTPAYDYTVRDFVVMGRAPHLGTFQQPGRADYDLVDATLEEMGLLPLANRPYTELSGGERQQVTIARGIVQQPADPAGRAHQPSGLRQSAPGTLHGARPGEAGLLRHYDQPQSRPCASAGRAGWYSGE